MARHGHDDAGSSHCEVDGDMSNIQVNSHHATSIATRPAAAGNRARGLTDMRNARLIRSHGNNSCQAAARSVPLSSCDMEGCLSNQSPAAEAALPGFFPFALLSDAALSPPFASLLDEPPLSEAAAFRYDSLR